MTMAGQHLDRSIAQMHFKKACIFVDGENLRYSLCDLFEGEFPREDYLPRKADWRAFFDDLVRQAGAELRLRAYWYVVNHIDFWPYRLSLRDHDAVELEGVLRKNGRFNDEMSAIADEKLRRRRCLEMAEELIRRQRLMQSRFDGWKEFQDGIMLRHEAVEFRRAGWVPYDLFWERMRNEKAVDVKLATDLLEFRQNYDIAIIVSGDGDYVPAVERVKDSGRHVVNVAFLKRDGSLVPGGARRLNMVADGRLDLDYGTVKRFMGLEEETTAK